jgi:hypothetical protein
MIHVVDACVTSSAVVDVEGFWCLAMGTELKRRRRVLSGERNIGAVVGWR